MRLTKIAEAVMWLPGFAPGEDPVAVHGPSGQSGIVASASFLPKASKPTKTLWPRLSNEVHADLSGSVTKFEANLTAIDLLQELEEEDRTPTDDERRTLNRYTGWGGLPQAFNLGQSDSAWVARANRLKEQLDEDEYRHANESTLNAHYTPIEVIKAVWKGVQQLGFNGGRILDPSAGTGYFIGAMPGEIAANSTVTAIELDAISSRILKALYGANGVRVKGDAFERVALPPEWFDLAISNIPFGNYKASEVRNVPYANFLIHDYFIARALEVVRPGGLVVVITSAGTMDKSGTSVREYIGRKANLLGAVRMPNHVFKQIAGAEVMTDILFLQKPLAGKASPNGWIDVEQIPKSSPINGMEYYLTPPSINEFYTVNPQWVIGKIKTASNGFQKVASCEFEGDLEEALAERIKLLPTAAYSSIEQLQDSKEVVKLSLTEKHRPGYQVIDGKVYTVTGSEAVLFKGTAKAIERIAGMSEVRNAARALVKAQVETHSDETLVPYRLALNVTYDRFVKKHGFLSEKVNRVAFREDPDIALLLSLEHWDDELQTAHKADIFDRRTVGVPRKVERCESAQEALTVSLYESGKINIKRIGQLLGIEGSKAMTELESLGAVFLSPETGFWETADAYLSGNVRRKLVVAKEAGERFNRNVEALEAVIPTDLVPSEIGARIGSTWISTRDYSQFLNETFGGTRNEVTFSDVAGAWNLTEDYSASVSVAATQTYGSSRVTGLKLFEQALNQQVPTVSDYDSVKEKPVVNQEETILAREKQQLLKEYFVEWLWSDEARAMRLVRVYNDLFNSVVAREYDGSHLVLPGFSQVYTLHKHQRDAIWRIVCGGTNTLLAHVVGAGKTLTMICAGMELRRLGKVTKPMYVVPNHMLEDFAAEFLRAYPGANILMASKDDLVGDKRRTLLSRVAMGDWDAVLLTHASYERIKMSSDFMEQYIDEEIAVIEDAIRAESSARGNRIVKELARSKKAWEARLSKLSATNKKDDLLSFEELGVDQVFIDEAHLFKNLWRFTKMNRIAGLPNSNSERAFDMFVKTRYVMEQHDNKAGVVFATGTPVSNSMAELWVMQRYLQPNTLRASQVDNFDTWAGNFGESVTALELSPDGSGYRMQTRFAKFINLPELMSMFAEVADIRTADMLDLPTPKANLQTVTAKPSPELVEFVQSLVDRAEKIRSGKVNPSLDNMLSVTNDGRKAALDMRLVNPFALPYQGSKVHLCAENVYRIWSETEGFKGTQLVFCDLSTPKANGQYSAYDDMHKMLVGYGIPDQEIAFIHDYDSDASKKALFRQVREGKVRVLLGSTGKMGMGTNVQTRLVALHHLDAPWRPSDVEQRDGRAIRQGNLSEEVNIYRYVTQGSFDAYMWQTLETKARFIAQVMSGASGIRTAEDVELAALSYAEVKALASGNPLVMEKAGVDSELAKLAVLKSKWDNQQWQNKSELANLPEFIRRQEVKKSEVEADIERRNKAPSSQRHISLKGFTTDDAEKVGEFLLEAAYGEKKATLNGTIGSIAGFDLVVAESSFGKYLAIQGAESYVVRGVGDTPAAMLKAVRNALSSMDRVLEDLNLGIAQQQKRLIDLRKVVELPFDKLDRLVELRQRQREIEEALDLTKGVTAAVEEVAEAA